MKHNRTLQRGLGVLFGLVLCLTLLTVSALAAEPASKTADFTAEDTTEALALLTTGDANTAADEDKAEWDSGTNTLTLKGVDFTTSAATAVKLPAGAKIVLAAGTENTITGVCDDTVPEESYGIYVRGGGLTIEGSGQLTVTAGKSIKRSYGIYVYYGELTITSGTVTANSGEAANSYGIDAYDVTISGKTTEVTAIGGSAKSDKSDNSPSSVGLSGVHINISGGTVIATGGGPADDKTVNTSIGIYTPFVTNAYLTVSGGTVIATGSDVRGSSSSNGIKAVYFTITGGTVTATGGKADDQSYGIYSPPPGGRDPNFSISDGHVTARTLADENTKTRMALSQAPSLSGSDYSWRINAKDPYTTGEGYSYDAAHTYVDFFFPKPISGCTVDPIPNQSYADGAELTPAVTVRDGDVTLTEDTDYTVSYQNNVNVGTATVTITGKVDYGGTTSVRFNIVPLDITTMAVTQEGCTYGETLPDYTLLRQPNSSTSETALYTGTLAKNGSDYSSAKKPTEAGSYTVTVFCETPDTNFKATASFTIDPRSIEDFTVTLSDTELAYTGDSQSVTVTAVGNQAASLAAGDYEASGTSGTNAGEYTVTVTGKGNYTGTATAPWRITKIDPPVPPVLTGIKGKTVSTVRLPNGWWWNDPAAILNASGTFKVRYTDETGNYNNVSGVDVTITAIEGYTVTATGLYGTTMEITPGDTYTGIFAAGEMVRLQIGKRDGYTLKDLTLAGITEDQLKWSAKDQEINDRGIGFTMPETDVTVTVNWTRIGGSGGASTATYAIAVDSAKNGAVTTSHQTASEGTTVTLTVTPDKGYTLETLTVTDGSGKKLALTDKGSGKYSFKMPASKATVKATFMEDNSMLNFFVDVPASAYYYDAVLWAAENGITGGTDAVHFSPDNACTRAQAVTFLWRAAGSPAPESRVNPFTDVKADAYYYDAVLWAVEQGITKGTSDTMFSPDTTCSRAQIVTFLWRSQKSPASDSVNPFADVAADAYYNSAVLWAVTNGITDGTSATTFSPNNDCTRAQIVTFLFRCLG